MSQVFLVTGAASGIGLALTLAPQEGIGFALVILIFSV